MSRPLTSSPGASKLHRAMTTANKITIGRILLVPFFIVPKLDWLFWGWLKSFIQFSFIPVVAIAFLMVFEQFVFRYVTTLPPTITQAEYGIYALQAVAVMEQGQVVYKRPESLSDNLTHYCPGCTHGIIHRLIGEAIEELGIQDRTIMVAPVGPRRDLRIHPDDARDHHGHGRLGGRGAALHGPAEVRDPDLHR